MAKLDTEAIPDGGELFAPDGRHRFEERRLPCCAPPQPRSLSIRKQTNDLVGLAYSYHELGMLARCRENYKKALYWLHRARVLKEQFDDRQALGNTYAELAIVALALQDYEAALDWNEKALSIRKDLKDSPGVALCYNQQGDVAIAQGNYKAAFDWYQKSLAIAKELDYGLQVAHSYHALGNIAYLQCEFKQALDWYREALNIFVNVDDAPGTATCYDSIGVLLTEAGRHEEGLPFNLRSFFLRLKLPVPVRTAIRRIACQRELLGEERFLDILREHVDETSAHRILQLSRKQR